MYVYTNQGQNWYRATSREYALTCYHQKVKGHFQGHLHESLLFPVFLHSSPKDTIHMEAGCVLKIQSSFNKTMVCTILPKELVKTDQSPISKFHKMAPQGAGLQVQDFFHTCSQQIPCHFEMRRSKFFIYDSNPRKAKLP